MSPTVLVSRPNPMVMAEMTNIAANDAGTIFVIFGKPQMISIVSATNPNIRYNCVPDIQANIPEAPATLN